MPEGLAGLLVVCPIDSRDWRRDRAHPAIGPSIGGGA